MLNHQKLNILIVDDIVDNLLALKALLEREDLNIFQALSGNIALELMMKHEFSLALIDVNMPSMSGFELAEFMRGSNRTKDIPIIFVTATAKEQRFSFKGYESGAVDFLLKPLDSHAVKSKVKIFVDLDRQKKELKNHLEIIYRNKLDLEVLLDKLKITQASLETAVHVRDDFMSIASHELKTPITSLMLQADLRLRHLKKQDPSFFNLERLSQMFLADQKQIKRLDTLIDHMLDVSRITSGKLSMNLEQFDICEFIRDFLERYSELFIAAKCPVKVDFCGVAEGNWDRLRIEQVVMNLLTNAMRYGAGKPIYIRIQTSHDHVQIAVQDHGRGIPKKDQERIFQKFERGVSEAEIKGLGLGLYLVKQIIEAHNGSIQVASEAGMGATFSIDLPQLESLATH